MREMGSVARRVKAAAALADWRRGTESLGVAVVIAVSSFKNEEK